MSIEGRIAVDVSFADSATSSGVQSLKKISLTDTTSYTTGKVAIVTGTIGTAITNINFSSVSYKNASGSDVSFSKVQRIAFSATPLAFLDSAAAVGGGDNVLVSQHNEATLVDGREGGQVSIYTTSGTASYTLVLYGT
jgi:hypothetical protein